MPIIFEGPIPRKAEQWPICVTESVDFDALMLVFITIATFCSDNWNFNCHLVPRNDSV